MSRELILALDQGSSSSRALAFDSRGRVVARVQRPIKTFRPRPGWVEHDPLDIARSMERSLDELLARLSSKDKILGLGLACQRSTVVFWDKNTGRPACRALSWQDGRAAELLTTLQEHQNAAHEHTGLYLTPYYSAPKIRHVFENNPTARRLRDDGVLRAGPVSAFLTWRLTSGERSLADPTLAQRMMLYNIRAMDWDPWLLRLFGVPPEVLPELVPTAGNLGVIRRGGRSFPLMAVVGDQQAALYALGQEEGAGLVNYGTGAFFLLNTGASQHRVPGLLTSVGWRLGASPAYYLQEGTVHAAGTSFEWLRDNFKLMRGASEIDRLCARSQNRLLALPAIGGLGAPRWDYSTPTVFFGLNSRSGPQDIVRGVTEGLAFLISDIVSALRSSGLNPGRLRAAGGLSRSSYLLQFQSDLLGLGLTRLRETEATAMGAAALAAKALGTGWGRFTVAEEKTFQPKMTPQDSERLRAQWRRFADASAELSRALGPIS